MDFDFSWIVKGYGKTFCSMVLFALQNKELSKYYVSVTER